jgi:hypothetical protein
MPPFHVADLNVRGEVQMQAEYGYPELEKIPGAADLIIHFSSQLYRQPKEFETTLPHGRAHMNFRWRAIAPDDTAGMATLRSRQQLASVALLACGKNPDADRITFEAFQKHLVRELHDTGFEPAFGLMELKQRPLVAVMTFLEPEDEVDRLVLALCDRCFAAAFFRYHQLA